MIERQRLVDDLIRDEGLRRHVYDPKSTVAIRNSLWAWQAKTGATRLRAQKQTGIETRARANEDVLCVS